VSRRPTGGKKKTTPSGEGGRRLIHVYTGDGKGKTTAALGMAFRACGQGWRVRMIQFLKGSLKTGEVKICKSLPNFTLVRAGRARWIDPKQPAPADARLARNAFRNAIKDVASGRYDMVILDELNMAVDFNLIPVAEVVGMLQAKPDSVEVVLTGRRAHADVVRLADYVSEIKEVKHPFPKRAGARKGVEF
jgi:cob(I)alamin adenosyltransferase